MGDTQLENGHRAGDNSAVCSCGGILSRRRLQKIVSVSHWVFLFGCLRTGIVSLEEDDPVAGMTWEASRFHARSRSQNACFRFPCFSREGVLVAGRGLGAEFFEDFGVWEVERFSRLLRPFVYACLEGSDSLGVGFSL